MIHCMKRNRESEVEGKRGRESQRYIDESLELSLSLSPTHLRRVAVPEMGSLPGTVDQEGATGQRTTKHLQ